MADSYLSSNLNINNPIPDGSPRINWPFWSEGDTTTITIEQNYVWTFDRYRPLPLNTPINIATLNAIGQTFPSNFSNCIFLEDTQPADEQGGFCKFTRTWGTVPITRSSRTSFSASLPGHNELTATLRILSAYTMPSGQVIPAVNINSGASVGNLLYGNFATLVRNRAGAIIAIVEANKRRQAKIQSLSPFSVYDDNGYQPSIKVDFPTFDANNLAGQPLLTGYQILSFTFLGWSNVLLKSRTPRSKLVSGVRINQYCIGVSEASLLAKPGFQIETSAGQITDTLTSTTIPSTFDWRTGIENGTYFNPEDSEITRYRGDVFQVSTMYSPYL